MNNVSMIICDIDRTITNLDKSITDFNKDVFKKCKSLGIKVCLCSGRCNSYITDLCKDTCVDYIISSNGSMVYDNNLKSVIYTSLIEKDELNRIVECANRYNITLLINGVNNRYGNNDNCLEIDSKTILYNNEDVLCTQVIPNSFNYDDIMKFLSIMNKDNLYNACNVSNNYNDLSIKGKRYWLDIVNKDENKGKGIKILCDSLGINLSDTICFGDSMNDLAMFKVCGVRVAVSNATDVIKDNSDYICGEAKDSGVGKFILDKIFNDNTNLSK